MLFAQQISVDEFMLHRNFKYKDEVITLWRNYYEASQKGESTAEYWAGEHPDYVSATVENFYTEYNHTLQIIESEVDAKDSMLGGYFLLTTLSRPVSRMSPLKRDVTTMLVARLTPEGWRLMSTLSVHGGYKKYSSQSVIIYHDGFVNQQELVLLVQRFDAFLKSYDIALDRPLTQIYDVSALSDMGIEAYVPAKNRAKKGLIVADKLAPFRDWVDATTCDITKNTHPLLREGFLAFVADSESMKATNRADAVNLLSRKKVDFKTIDKLNSLKEKNECLYYALGVALVEHCHNTKGAPSVIELLAASDYDAIFDYLGVAPAERTSFVYDLFGVARK